MESFVVTNEALQALWREVLDANAFFGPRGVDTVFLHPREDPKVHVHDMRRSTASVASVNQYFFRIYVLKVIISPRWSLEGLPHFLAQFLVIGRIYPWWKLVSKGRRLSLKPRYLEAARGA